MHTLVYISLLISSTVLAAPTIYKDRQDGGSNVRADFEDINVFVIPSTKLVEELVSAFGRQNAGAQQVTAAEGQSKQLERHSPYTVELSSAAAEEAKPGVEVVRIPAIKIEETIKIEQEVPLKPVEQPAKAEKKPVKKQEEPVKVAEAKPLKKVEDPKKKAEEVVKKVTDETPKKTTEKKKTEDATKKGSDDGRKKMKMDEETLTLIQEGLEECGPDGQRNKEGICVYTPITP